MLPLDSRYSPDSEDEERVEKWMLPLEVVKGGLLHAGVVRGAEESGLKLDPPLINVISIKLSVSSAMNLFPSRFKLLMLAHPRQPCRLTMTRIPTAIFCGCIDPTMAKMMKDERK